MRKIALIGLVIGFAGIIHPFLAQPLKPEIWTVYFKSIKGREVPAYCEVARTESEKERGLMFRDKLEEDECMIFLYNKPIMLTFWMKNTLLPLSIAFLDDQKKIIDIFDMRPRDETIISSTLPAQYAIEVNRGWYKKNYIFQGARSRFVMKDERIEIK